MPHFKVPSTKGSPLLSSVTPSMGLRWPALCRDQAKSLTGGLSHFLLRVRRRSGHPTWHMRRRSGEPGPRRAERPRTPSATQPAWGSACRSASQLSPKVVTGLRRQRRAGTGSVLCLRETAEQLLQGDAGPRAIQSDPVLLERARLDVVSESRLSAHAARGPRSPQPPSDLLSSFPCRPTRSPPSPLSSNLPLTLLSPCFAASPPACSGSSAGLISAAMSAIWPPRRPLRSLTSAAAARRHEHTLGLVVTAPTPP